MMLFINCRFVYHKKKKFWSMQLDGTLCFKDNTHIIAEFNIRAVITVNSTSRVVTCLFVKWFVLYIS